MGHAGLEAKWDEMGIVQAGGVGGPGTGSGRVDAIGYRPGELHVGECKGGTSAKVGTYEVDGVKVEQGSAAYVGIAWPRTWIFTRRCVRTRRCGRPSRTGASRCIPTSRSPAVGTQGE